MNKFAAVLSLFLISSLSARAENINIDADQKVEVHQNEQKIIAVGNAVVNKKDNTIYADEMTAFYQKTPAGKTNFTSVHAKGHVRAVSPTMKAFGNIMDYDLGKEEIILIGTPAKIQNTKGETVSADEKIIYYPKDNRAVATGNVVATDKENNVYSDKMVSYFTKDKDGNMEMDKVNIYDHVKIVTPQAVATSDRGTYFPKKGLVHLYDNVVINQDGNILKGDFAETDLNTGISRMLSKKNSKKRVSGVFREKEKNDKKPQQPVKAPEETTKNAQ